MSKLIVKLVVAIAVAFTLAACSTYRESAPAWMPGSGAMNVNLSGSEEVPPLTVPGSGSGTIRVAEDGTISGSVTTKDVEGTMAHIHRGAKGTNGPVIVPLEKKGDTYSVPAGRKLTAEQLKDLKAGNLYVNVHTNRNKGGEVRGQLNP
jgi:hypothetical protein